MSQHDHIDRAEVRRELWRLVALIVSAGALFGIGFNMANLLFDVLKWG